MVGNTSKVMTKPPVSGAEHGEQELDKHRQSQQTEDNRRYGGEVIDIDLNQVHPVFLGANSSR